MASDQFSISIPNQSGRTAIVTGANSGLGFEICKALARHNEGEAARKDILAQYPSGDLQVEPLDVSCLTSVREFAERICTDLDRVDLLINNAGVMGIPSGKSADGYEMQFATNHLGHFLLTGLLLPKLLGTPDSRVVPVSSIGARKGRIDFDDLLGEKHYNPWKAYNQSKLANLVFGLELQRRLELSGSVTSAITAHPGASLTNLFSTPGGTVLKRWLTALVGRFMYQSAEAGAQPILYAATSADAKPGGFYGPANLGELKGPPAEAKIPAAAQDTETARKLWQISEELAGFRYLTE